MGVLDIFKIEETRFEKEKLEQEVNELEHKKIQLLSELSNIENKSKELENENNSLLQTKQELDKQIQNRENFFIETELKYIDTLNGLEFEVYTAELLKKLGFLAVVTKATQDDGGDVLAEKDGVKYVFQCKNYSSVVGNKAIQEVYTAKGIYKCDAAEIITNNFFTKQAQDEANILNIKLIDRDYLKVLLYQAFSFDISHLDIFKNHRNTYNSYDTDLKDIDEEDDIDPLLDEAIQTIIETGQASTSFIQRRFKIGFARAGRIIDQMEERGIISGYQGSKPRDVLMSMEKWKELKDLDSQI